MSSRGRRLMCLRWSRHPPTTRCSVRCPCLSRAAPGSAPSPARLRAIGVSPEKLIMTPHSICWTDECFAGIGAACVEHCLALAGGSAPAIGSIVGKGVVEESAFTSKLAKL